MKRFICLIVLISTLLTSCTIYQQKHKELIKLKKGLSSAEVISIIDSDQYNRIFSYNGNYTNEIKIPNNSNKYSLIIGGIVLSKLSAKYIYAFDNDKLIYWGTAYEFARNSSPLINQIGEEGVKLFDTHDKE